MKCKVSKSIVIRTEFYIFTRTGEGQWSYRQVVECGPALPDKTVTDEIIINLLDIIAEKVK